MKKRKKKTIISKKQILIIFLLFLYNLNAKPLINTKTSSNLENVSLAKIINSFEKQIGYHLFYNRIPLKKIKNQDKIQIEGTVNDKEGNPIPGASVIEKGTDNGTVTDFDGKFTIKVKDENAILEISYLGYNPIEIKVGNQRKFDITLTGQEYNLDEVVVIGYGTTKKKLSTGSNLNVKGKDIESLSPSTAMQALQGISPGVSITQNNGQPGAGTKVYIRGIGTTGNSKPLYIVDGVTVGNIDYLSPSDIKSIDILKDAASSAIYGARAANGVVLVTTKKGKKGTKPKVTFDSYYGFQNVYRKPGLLNAQEYAYIMNEGRLNDGLPFYDYDALIPSWNEVENGWKGTNWFDEMTHHNAPVSNLNVNILGGSENIIYSLGASKYEQDGIIGGNIIDAGFKRLTLRLNTELTLAKNKDHNVITIGENLTYSNTRIKKIADGGIYFNDVHNALITSPFMPVYTDGNYTKTYENWDASQVNPIGIMDFQRNNVWNKNNGIVGNFYLEIEPVKDLKIKSNYGINSWFGHSRSYVPTYDLGTLFTKTDDEIRQGTWQGSSWVWTNTINFKKSINDHKFDILLGSELNKKSLDLNLSAGATNSNFDDPDYAYLINVDIRELSQLINISGMDWAAQGGGLASFFTRVSYNYKEKYLLTGVLRADGSSNFAKGKRWGTFPSISIGWVVSNEDFMENNDYINSLKLRASWGQNGNQAIPNFGYSSTISFNGSYFFGNNNTVSSPIAYPARVPNLDTTWETSEQTNFGIDARLFSKFTLTFDIYKKLTKDWLVNPPILATAGAPGAFINGGEIENKGFELALGWKENKETFTWGITANIAYNKNEVTKIANSEKIIHGPNNVLSQGTSEVVRAEVGHPIGYFWAFETNGIIQNLAEAADYQSYFSDAKPGDVRFVDQNNDGVIDDLDKVEIGDPLPDFVYGFQLNSSYKGWYANATFTGQAGVQVMKSYRSFADKFKQNYTREIFGRWHGEGTSNRLPRLSSTSHRNTNFISDIYMHDADFFRVSNITIGYNFNKFLNNTNYISNLKLYVTGKNLFTFTKYNGMDPEVGYGPTPWSSGVDLGLYPSSRSFMIGINATF